MSLSSLLWPLLVLEHPGEALKSWPQALDHSHISSPLVELSLTLKTPSGWTDTIFSSFILCICFRDRFEQQPPFLSHFLLNKEAFQECWSTLSLLWGSNALCDNVCAALSPCPFCQIVSSAHLTLRRCSLADPTHGAVTGGQHCTLA